MPRKRATRVNKATKPKKPENDIGNHLNPEERRQKLEVFVKDFDMEVAQRLRIIEDEKSRLQSLIEKELNMQLSYLPMEIRKMNIMDFVGAGGTVEAAFTFLQNPRKDTVDSEATHSVVLTNKKGRAKRKGKATEMAPPSSTVRASSRLRTAFQTPFSRHLPAVWDTPAVTPKFDINLPFTPGIARPPQNGERLMSLAGSPVDISSTQRTTRTLKHITEEDEVESAISQLAAAVPGVSENAIHKFLTNFSTAKTLSYFSK